MGGLDAAVAARTALASTHSVSLVFGSEHLPGPWSALDDDGEPVLLGYGAAPLEGSALVCAASGGIGVGRVLLDGVLRPLTGPARLTALDLFRQHATCIDQPDPAWIHLSRLYVTDVTWESPTGDRQRVPLAAYGAAAPCPWALHAQRFVDHLNRDHPALVARLTTLVTGHRDAVGWVRSLGPHDLRLAVIDRTGARDHTLSYGRTAADPRDAVNLVTAWAGSTTHSHTPDSAC